VLLGSSVAQPTATSNTALAMAPRASLWRRLPSRRVADAAAGRDGGSILRNFADAGDGTGLTVPVPILH